MKEREEKGKKFHTTEDLATVLLKHQPNKAQESSIKFLSRCF